MSCVIDIYSNDAWAVLLKDKKGITMTNAFQKMLDESSHKPNKIWVDKGSEFYNKSMKLLLEKKCHRNVFNTMRENLLLLKDLSELLRIKSINIGLQYQKMCILIN